LNLFAAFDSRSGKVYGQTAGRKRQTEFIIRFPIPHCWGRSLVLKKLKVHEEGLRQFDAICRGDRAEADQGDGAQQSLFNGERRERPFECAF
jgi:hypothetical protein